MLSCGGGYSFSFFLFYHVSLVLWEEEVEGGGGVRTIIMIDKSTCDSGECTHAHTLCHVVLPLCFLLNGGEGGTAHSAEARADVRACV